MLTKPESLFNKKNLCFSWNEARFCGIICSMPEAQESPASTLNQSNPPANEKKEEVKMPIKEEPEKVLITWTAAARPFKRRDREFYITVIAIAAIVGLILFLVEGFMPVVLLVSLIFLFYVLSTVEPEAIEYKITTKGIKVEQRLTEWNNLTRFWFSRRFDSELLIFEEIVLPGRMELVLDPNKKEEIKKTLSSYLMEEEAPPSFLDRSANWLSKKLPGNN